MLHTWKIHSQSNKVNSIRKSTQYPMWFTKSIIVKIKEGKKIWNLYRKTKFHYHLDNVKKLRREIKREIREEYKHFVITSQDSLQTNKKIWTFVNQKKRTTSISGFTTHRGNSLNSPEEITRLLIIFIISNVYDPVNDFCDNSCNDNKKSREFCDRKTSPSWYQNNISDNHLFFFSSMFTIMIPILLKLGKRSSPIMSVDQIIFQSF